MRVVKIGFVQKVVPDNEATYFSNLEGYVESLDSESVIRITNKPSGISVRISPSHTKYLNPILQGMKAFHSQFGIKLNFSKSMKSSATVTFSIDF